eukprot:scaffold134764_cov35-Prasinocladus_malaysianus.AAC.1
MISLSPVALSLPQSFGANLRALFVSPIKIVKNPDGSMQRAAMTQSALMKERRELKEQQQRSELEAVPKDLSRPWEDPMPEQVGLVEEEEATFSKRPLLL